MSLYAKEVIERLIEDAGLLFDQYTEMLEHIDILDIKICIKDKLNGLENEVEKYYALYHKLKSNV